MNRPGAVATLLFVLLAAGAAAIVARSRYSTDLSAFLPRHPSAAQQLLVEQLRTGPGARLLLLAIEGGTAATRAQLSQRLSSTLKSDPSLSSISNGAEQGLTSEREFLFTHRYLMSSSVTPQRFSVAGLHAAISDSLDELAAPAGALLKPLFPRDPTGELLGIIENLTPARAPRTDLGVWSSRDGRRALLIAQTRAVGSDTDGQQSACQAVRRAFAGAVADLPPAQRGGVRLLMTGPPVFAVDARTLIKGEVMRLSGVSALLIALLLLAVYRSGAALALTLVPVAAGALAGVAAVALGFDAVHGITLGFGITLIGEAVDYTIYLFVQRAANWRVSVWPTIRLGMLTSVCGFAALLPSAFTGLAQLGLYSVSGLIAAALVTRYVLPSWLPRDFAIRDLRPAGAALARVLQRLAPLRWALLAVALFAGAVLYLHRGPLWNRELQALNPIPAADQALDEQLSSDLGAPDVRYVVVVRAREREALLEAAEAVAARLTPLVEAGLLGGFQSPTRYLPARSVQQARQRSLPDAAELQVRLREALTGLPVSLARLGPFVADVERARTEALITPQDLAGSPLGGAAEGLITESPTGWTALLPLEAVSGPDLSAEALARLRSVLAEPPVTAAVLLDLKGEADGLYSDYLSQGARLAAAGLVAILVLLALTLRSAARVLRVVAPLILAVLTVAALLVALGRQLTILHLVGMLLIVAVGSNYALFFDRSSAAPQSGSVPLTLASILVANIATVVTFGVLASSRVPLLADLGMTVAPGTLLALWFAALMAKAPAAQHGAAAS